MGKPKPFSRPSIDLGSPKKDWREVSVYSIREGDMVRSLGLVLQVWDAPDGVAIKFKSGDVHFYAEGDVLTAFVRV